MQYRKDAKSSNDLSILGFGCMRFPGGPLGIDLGKSEKLVIEAYDSGVNYFDTAYNYPGNEAALGQILARNPIREKIHIATKLPLTRCHSWEDFDSLFNTQLERLGTDYVDYYLMHAISGPAQWEGLQAVGIEEWIAEQKKEGRIRQLGFSFHGSEGDFLSLLDRYDWQFCQIQYNYMNIHYQAGQRGLQAAAERGLPVIIMEPLLGGRLASGLPPAALQRFQAQRPEWSPAAWGLNWLWNQPEVTTVLSGMNAPAQLAENLALAEAARPAMLDPQDEEALQEVIRIFNAAYKVPCTGCNYCMPCPQGIDIPGCFAAYNSSYALGYMAGVMQYTMATGSAMATPHTARSCVSCGKCVSHCPQQIPIPQALEQVGKRMEPFWYRGIMAAARGFRRGGNKKS